MKNAHHILRVIASWLGVILTTTNAVAWPTSIRATVLAVSGVLLIVQHGISTMANEKADAAAKTAVNTILAATNSTSNKTAQ